ncbi:MAG: hypothetical protein HY868_25530 [Chloroflexi bacterium]|nr:hypothetical protein [Chloroflexota bacterium]
MSAICTTQAKTDDSLSAKVEQYAKEYAVLNHLRRAAACMILAELDVKFPPSDERIAVRKAVMDSLGWYSREVQRWVSQGLADSATPSPNSRD